MSRSVLLTLGLLLTACAIVACGDPESGRAGSTEAKPTTASPTESLLPTGFRALQSSLGFSVGYPESWSSLGVMIDDSGAANEVFSAPKLDASELTPNVLIGECATLLGVSTSDYYADLVLGLPVQTEQLANATIMGEPAMVAHSIGLTEPGISNVFVTFVSGRCGWIFVLTVAEESLDDYLDTFLQVVESFTSSN